MYKPRLECGRITITGICVYMNAYGERVYKVSPPINALQKYAKHESKAMMGTKEAGKERKKKRNLSQTERRRSSSFFARVSRVGGEVSRRFRNHIDWLSVAVLSDLSIRLPDAHTKRKGVLSKISH